MRSHPSALTSAKRHALSTVTDDIRTDSISTRTCVRPSLPIRELGVAALTTSASAIRAITAQDIAASLRKMKPSVAETRFASRNCVPQYTLRNHCAKRARAIFGVVHRPRLAAQLQIYKDFADTYGS